MDKTAEGDNKSSDDGQGGAVDESRNAIWLQPRRSLGAAQAWALCDAAAGDGTR